MSFSINIKPVAEFKLIQIFNESTREYIVLSTKGGLLNNWVQPIHGGTFDVIDGNNLDHEWGNFEETGFKSGKMIPFSCRLQNGKYTHESIAYTIEKYYLGQHAIHGVLYDALFEIEDTECNEEQASVLLKFNYNKLDKGFPFHFTVHIKWTFENKNKVIVSTTITNEDQVSFPIMDGWHPYFKLGESINNCTIQFCNKGILEYNKELIPTGNLIPNNEYENPKSLVDIELDNGFLLDQSNPNCILENDSYKLVVTPDGNYSYLQLYTPPGRKSIAIENLSAAPDCFNNKMGLHIMQPQEVWTLTTQFQLFNKKL
jgi:aldose 1-epimerase